MDKLTRAYFELQFRVLFFIDAKGNEFQSLFSRIMSMRYPADFMAVRPWGNEGDRKSDGYLPSRRNLFQCYAPNDLKAVTCVAKIEEDFTGAISHWERYFDMWTFVHNTKDLPPHVVEKLLELETRNKAVKVNHWGFEEIRHELFQLAECDLSALLGPAPTQATVVALGVNDLEPILRHIAHQPPTSAHDLRPVPAEKLAYNQLSDDAATLLTAGMTRADLLRKYFRLRPRERDSIAETFKQTYECLRGDRLPPDELLMGLRSFASGGLSQATPAREAAILAVLAYFFEECDIFERPEAES